MSLSFCTNKQNMKRNSKERNPKQYIHNNKVNEGTDFKTHIHVLHWIKLTSNLTQTLKDYIPSFKIYIFIIVIEKNLAYFDSHNFYCILLNDCRPQARIK